MAAINDDELNFSRYFHEVAIAELRFAQEELRLVRKYRVGSVRAAATRVKLALDRLWGRQEFRNAWDKAPGHAVA